MQSLQKHELAESRRQGRQPVVLEIRALQRREPDDGSGLRCGEDVRHDALARPDLQGFQRLRRLHSLVFGNADGRTAGEDVWHEALALYDRQGVQRLPWLPVFPAQTLLATLEVKISDM